MKMVRFGFWGMLVLGLLAGCAGGPSSRAVAAASDDAVKIKFDGVYFSPIGRGVATSYVRFFDNGTVVSVSAMAKPDDVKSWLNADNENVSIGTYALLEDKVAFAAKSSLGSVDYIGKVVNDKLVLDSRSNINGHEEKGKVYTFYKW
jgi:hypothetical protein